MQFTSAATAALKGFDGYILSSIGTHQSAGGCCRSMTRRTRTANRRYSSSLYVLRLFVDRIGWDPNGGSLVLEVLLLDRNLLQPRLIWPTFASTTCPRGSTGRRCPANRTFSWPSGWKRLAVARRYGVRTLRRWCYMFFSDVFFVSDSSSELLFSLDFNVRRVGALHSSGEHDRCLLCRLHSRYC